MKLWLISQENNNDYDTYDSAVVAAKTISEARNTHPSGNGFTDLNHTDWVTPHEVKVNYLGVAKIGTKFGVICASFHAG